MSRLDPAEPCESGDVSPHSKAAARRAEPETSCRDPLHNRTLIIPLNSLFTALRQSEYLHVLLNPLPVYGLAMGALALVVGLAMKSRPALVVALVIVLVSSAAAWPTYLLGQNAYDITYAASDADGTAWLVEHKTRAAKLIWTFYALAVLAAAAIGAPLRWPRAGLPLAAATLLGAVAVLGTGGWIAYAGGKIRHRELRFEPPPNAKFDPQSEQ